MDPFTGSETSVVEGMPTHRDSVKDRRQNAEHTAKKQFSCRNIIGLNLEI